MRWIGQVPKIIVQAEEKIVEVPQAQTRGKHEWTWLTWPWMDSMEKEKQRCLPWPYLDMREYDEYARIEHDLYIYIYT